MPKLILVSATEAEILPTLHFLSPYKVPGVDLFEYGKVRVSVCITGVGMVNTAFTLGRIVGENYDLAVNAGVAGSFTNLAHGTVVNVFEDCYSELGAEDDENFLTVDELGFGVQKIHANEPLESSITDRLPKVKSITVNTVHGNENSIKKISSSHAPDIESMEGAAFFHAANFYQWSAVQLRAISNKVEKRNRGNWDLPLAIKNLNTVLIDLIRDLNGL